MIGSYGPSSDPHVKRFESDEAPSGMLARSGTYAARSRITDDDGTVWLDFECRPLAFSSNDRDAHKIEQGPLSFARTGSAQKDVDSRRCRKRLGRRGGYHAAAAHRRRGGEPFDGVVLEVDEQLLHGLARDAAVAVQL